MRRPASAAELTPDGPASLKHRWTGASVAMLTPPVVVTHLRVTVSEGGRAGTVRAQGMAADRSDPWSPIQYVELKVGPPAMLPAEPGVYTIPAPRVHMGWHYTTRLGLVQESGGHAIVDVKPCTPEQGQGADWCQIAWLDGWPGGSRGGAQLAIEAVTEPDLDRDLRGDTTEDRTDLSISAGPARTGADGRLRTPLTITNNGPLAADRAAFTTPPGERDRICVPLATAQEDGWEAGCLPHVFLRDPGHEACVLDGPLAPGASRTLTYVSRGAVEIVAAGDGPDLNPADNTATAGVPGVPGVQRELKGEAAPKLTLKGKATLRPGIKVTVRGQGRTKVTATFKVRGRTVRLSRTVTLKDDAARTVTLRATGARLRTLRRAAARGSLRATITVRDAKGVVATATARVS